MAASGCSSPPPTRPSRARSKRRSRTLPKHERARRRAAARAARDRALLPRPRRRGGAERARRRGCARAPGDPAALAAALNARRVALLDARAHRGAARRGDRDDRGRRGRGRSRRRPAGPQLAGRGPDGARRPRPRSTPRSTPTRRSRTRVGLAHYRWYVPLWRAALAQLEGRWAEAEALGREALALAAQAGDPMAPWLVRAQRESTLEARGPLRRGRPRLARREAAASAEPWAWLTYLAYFDATAATSSARGERCAS